MLNSKKDESLNWFKNALAKKVRSICSISFWEDPWLGSTPL